MVACSVYPPKEVKLSELISKVVPCAELVRLVNTGMEATMNAIRLAQHLQRKRRF